MIKYSIFVAIFASAFVISLALEEGSNVERRTEIFEPATQPVYVQAGQDFELKCRQLDCMSIRWVKENEEINSDAKSGYLTTSWEERRPDCIVYGNLKKTKATMKDSGGYSCEPRIDANRNYIATVKVFEIIPNSDTLVYGKNAVLNCEVKGLTSYKPLLWYRHGNKIVPDGEKYIISDLNNNLTITHANENDVGEYVCGFELDNKQNFSQVIHLYAKPHVDHFEAASKNLVQGDPLVLACNAWGHPMPVVNWLKDGEPLDESDTRITIVDNGIIVNGTLRIENLDYPDRANYTCVATFDGNSANTTILVRVKDKLAALWPFLGICVEVIVLCVIIFIYEKRRAKKMADEEPPEEAGHLTNSNDHKGKDDIRQRK